MQELSPESFQKLLQEMVEKAHKLAGTPGVVGRHPRAYLSMGDLGLYPSRLLKGWKTLHFSNVPCWLLQPGDVVECLAYNPSLNKWFKGTHKVGQCPFRVYRDRTPKEKPDMNEGNIHRFESGAVRQALARPQRFDLISPFALRRLAETCAEGAAKYGEWNWVQGIPFSDLLNRAIRHLYLFAQRDKEEDHLAHAFWNIMALLHFSETRPDLDDRYQAEVKKND